ncbi:hypothetical protein PBY51_005777 [Eleginops maclovinus]|uniref:Uncharacterized protein n=1 Tax=Eleginops maclovinus TaxID=56733 RepID=A0AAN7WS37_ELEMC|nr:hypothetical protein PBY51_005777 [Eleginops maclovinus]
MDRERQERRDEEEEEEETLTPSRRREEEEEEMMKAGPKNRVVIGHTPISASSSLSSFPFISSSLCQGGRGGGEDDEVNVAIVTIEDESCPSEPFGIAHQETANQIARIEGGRDEKEEEEKEERNSEEEEEEEEMTSPSLYLQSQVSAPTTDGLL